MSRLVRIALCLLMITSLALAQTVFTVTSTSDSGSGSLRQALVDAVTELGAVSILFDPGKFATARTIDLTSGVLTISKSDISIKGPGANLVTVSGRFATQVFLINSGVTKVAIHDLTIANGAAPYAGNGGGCIFNSGQLSLTSCVISHCTAPPVAGADGGGVRNSGTLVVDSCTFSGNTAISGGAISSTGGSLTVSRSAFTGNSADTKSAGDAIFVDLSASVIISDSTFYNNGKSTKGNAAISGRGTTLIQRCTITANYGTAGDPGGLLISGGTTTLEGNIIYGNLGTGNDVAGNSVAVIDNGYNIIGTALGFTPTSVNLGNPLLLSLADNGGPTQTCALGIGSPAINAANPTWIGTTDQRGLPQVGPRDIGAFEFQFTVTNSLNGGSGSLRWAINAANAVASGAVIINFDVVTFSIAQTIPLASRLPTITKSDLTIIGPGASLVTISGQDATPIFFINGGITNVVMLGLTIAQGKSDDSYFDGGCIANNGQLSVTGCVITQCSTHSYGDGGGILNAGTLVIDSCTFSGNSAEGGVGGAIQHNGVSLTVSRSTFITNIAKHGGHAINNFFGSATITDSTFYNNGQLEMHSTAISSRGTAFIKQCTITANYGDSDGFPGGLAVFAGTTTIENNIIYGNLGGPDVLFDNGGINSGTITDKGYNIIGTSSGFTPAGTNVAGDPLLSALADNGGPTQTCALGAGSPAINAANPALKNTPDQRGLPQVGQRDIGAFEVQSGTGGGDPSFVGFMGQKFGFAGKQNKSFHIFSDPYITINSRFAVANPSKGKGTVMYAFGIRWENHTVTFGVDSFIKNKEASLLISIDGRERILPRSNQPVLLDNCVNATWSFPKLRIITPLHNIVIDWRLEHNDHINGSYLNIRINAPLDNPTLCGGILGQTASSAKNVKSLSKKDSDFITSDDMISSEAKTSKFSARAMLCAAVPTQPPSTAVAAHEHDGDTHDASGMRI